MSLPVPGGFDTLTALVEDVLSRHPKLAVKPRQLSKAIQTQYRAENQEFFARRTTDGRPKFSEQVRSALIGAKSGPSQRFLYLDLQPKNSLKLPSGKYWACLSRKAEIFGEQCHGVSIIKPQPRAQQPTNESRRRSSSGRSSFIVQPQTPHLEFQGALKRAADEQLPAPAEKKQTVAVDIGQENVEPNVIGSILQPADVADKPVSSDTKPQGGDEAAALPLTAPDSLSRNGTDGNGAPNNVEDLIEADYYSIC